MSESPNTKLSREEIAEMEVGKTSVNRATSAALVAAFILTIVGVPVTQHIIEIRAGFARSGSWTIPSAYEIFNHLWQAGAVLLEPAHGDFLERLREANGVLMRGFQHYEEALEGDSSLRIERFRMRRHSLRNS